MPNLERSPIVTRSATVMESQDSNNQVQSNIDNTISENRAETDMQELRQQIAALSQQLTNLSSENINLRQTISSMQSTSSNTLLTTANEQSHRESLITESTENVSSLIPPTITPLIFPNATLNNVTNEAINQQRLTSSLLSLPNINPIATTSATETLNPQHSVTLDPSIQQHYVRTTEQCNPLQQWLTQNSYQNLFDTSSNVSHSHQKLYDLPEFSGKPEEWPLFYSAFLETTKDFRYSHLQNTLRLNKSLKGKAKQSVESLLINPNNALKVIQILEFQYGRPELLLQSQLNLIRNIRPIDDSRLNDLIEYSIKIQNFTSFIETMRNHQHHLSNPTILQEMVEKIPINKRTEWMKYALTILPYPTIRHFANWLYNEAQLLSLVMTTPQKQMQRINVIDEIVCEREIETKTTSKAGRISYCPLCKEDGHMIYYCTSFKQKSLNDRWATVKELKLCISCLKQGHSILKCENKRECGIRNCLKNHSKFLHFDDRSKILVQEKNEKVTDVKISEEPKLINCNNDGSKLLFKIVPVRIYGQSKSIECYAFIDEGSNTSLIDSTLVDELGIKYIRSRKFNTKWYNGDTSSEEGYEVDLQIGPLLSESRYDLKGVYAVKNLDLPLQSLDLSSISQKHKGLDSLVSHTFSNAKPKIMLGLKHCHLFFPEASTQIAGLCVIQCKLGNVVYGRLNQCNEAENHILLLNKKEDEDNNLTELLKSYINNDGFENENTVESNSDINLKAMKLMKETTSKVEERFQTGLLWIDKNIQMPNNFDLALKRLEAIEQKMERDPVYKSKYEDNLMQYVSKGYARKLENHEIHIDCQRKWYLPHFAAHNPNKPNKFRIVFDAAATYKGVSLNNCLMKGPDLNQPMINILFNFRVGSIAITGDIKEMFPQIKIIPEDQNAQRFLWRHDRKESDIEHYVMTSMIFGASCSPTSAQYVKNVNASLYSDKYPEAAEAILKNHYVDDYVKSFNDIQVAKEVSKQVIEIHKKGGFELRNFVSNSPELLEFLGEHNESRNKVERVLGLTWDVRNDFLRYTIPFHKFPEKVMNGNLKPTKREILMIVMSIFDPFGFLNNFTIHGRLLIQDLWSYKLNWDSPIPDSLIKIWEDFKDGLSSIADIRIPRCLSASNLLTENVQLHIFVDASDKVYCSVAYLRIFQEEIIQVSLLASKVRVKSNKKIVSIPRMELQGAVLGKKLQNMILENLTFISKDEVYFWCDSQVVLSWIHSDTSNFKPFVAHRLTEIRSATDVKSWRYIPSNLNVADDATKRKGKLSLSNSIRWLSGPEFLKNHLSTWPKPVNCYLSNDSLEEYKNTAVVNVIYSCDLESIINLRKFSSFRKLKRVTAWVLKAVFIFIHKTHPNKSSLTYEDLQKAEIFLIKEIQSTEYMKEIECLKRNTHIPKSSSLRKLCPFLDENGILRVGGRLQNALCMTYHSRHPVILPKSNYVSLLVIRQFHEEYLHQNHHTVINEIRLKFWIPSLKPQLRKIINSCQFCKIRNAQPIQPIMSALPVERVTPFQRPFTFCGMDYCGPFFTKNGKKEEKKWILLFTCMNTRAIHLEVSTNLKSSSCLLAISNFINRRGVPAKVRSDNASYFKCTKKRIVEIISKEDIERVADKFGFQWVFNTPQSPHMGGVWERLIQCCKKVLEISLSTNVLNREIFESLVIQAENIVNSRPLTDVPIENEFSECLTPNHFLLGQPSSLQTFVDSQIQLSLPKQFRIMKQMKRSLWSKWIKQYLPDLTKRTKWFRDSKSISLGDLVLMCNDKESYNKWERGRVVKLFPGKDLITRSVGVKTARGIFNRAVNRLAVLDVRSENV